MFPMLTSAARRNSIAMLVTGFATPIVLTAATYVPLVSGFLRKLKPYLVWPSTVGTYNVRPLPYLLGNAPTVGQALYIAMFVILNVVLTAVNFQSRQPNAWYSNTWRYAASLFVSFCPAPPFGPGNVPPLPSPALLTASKLPGELLTRGGCSEIMAYFLYRTGNFAYIMAPLIFLFAGRNNVLLWLTNWSHSTFMVLHRWVARVFTLQVLLHSIVAVVLYKEEGTYDMNVTMPYWIWGIVATLCCVLLTFGSGLFVRKVAYEFFLITHVVLSVILIVGCWYHAYDLYVFLGGYSDWIYAMSAVWFFDRLARVARVVVSGPCRARVTELGEGYVRVDIPGIRWGTEPGKHAYVYFPTLHKLRPWENHPFSVLPTVLLQQHPPRGGSDSGSPSLAPDVEKHKPEVNVAHRSSSHPTVGLTLYVKKSEGMTRSLRANDGLLTLVEGPYPNNTTRELLRCDRLLLIGGGIGITSLLPFASSHWNVKLAWSVKESARCLAEDLDGALSTVADKDVRIGSRLDVEHLLAEEVTAGWPRVGVVVSGPGGLCDDVRAAVAAAGRRGGTEFELEVEAFTW